MQLTLTILSFLQAPAAVTACEGECIIGITSAFLGHYTSAVFTTLQTMANQINTQLIPVPARQQNPTQYFDPVLEAYNLIAYVDLETAIFPRYFHGKCQDANGVDPPGCPNPDCPRVCGTPGSLVHFYPTLTSIVFNQTTGLLANLTTPGSKTYNQVLQAVMSDANEGQRKRLENLSRIMPLRSRGTIEARGISDTQHGLKNIMQKLPSIMLHACGGSGLSLCSWEQPMKEFILQYP
ncbi:hypothetical protein K503DRAFT_850088 [Rhizopogon vinicolor AM-OR11-026]|uniref:Uncharacterized protein n=1 Tax=Rhizopogon vinicolor AM-OR11-026 TaxID=1314800 RepID=A0A1B7N080_9AGAM|nr:hypothetical protein K503DRAFT_850088 [Rhizopogon vinicolor AM-OR11-026]